VELYEKHKNAGLCILAFPCNQFGGQEPGTEAEILEFANSFGVKFDMFSKINVNGSDAHPLWKWMKDQQGGFLGSFIKWNFTKFLVNKQGEVVKRFGPKEEPNSAEADIIKLLK
jgi:glutathione peroxidase-family protein